MEKREEIGSGPIPIVAAALVLAVVIAGLLTGKPSAGLSPAVSRFLDSTLFLALTYEEAMELVVLGFLSGTVGGMLGMGGGVLKVASLHLYMGFGIHFARIVSLLSYVVISSSAYMSYSKYRLIRADVVKLLVPASVLGILIGMVIENWINKDWVEILVGVYALMTGIVVVNRMWTGSEKLAEARAQTEPVNETRASMIGIGMGVISSLIGISGGVVSTPLQQSLLRLPLKTAIANTIAAAIFCSAIASAIILGSGIRRADFLLSEVLVVLAFLVPGNLVGGRLGSYLTKHLSVVWVQAAFVLVIFVIGFRIMAR